MSKVEQEISRLRLFGNLRGHRAETTAREQSNRDGEMSETEALLKIADALNLIAMEIRSFSAGLGFYALLFLLFKKMG